MKKMDEIWLKCVAIATAVLVLLNGCHGNRLSRLQRVDDYLNICMDGLNHKLKPGPEGDLFQQCSPWSEKSCCTSEIAEQMHVNATWYKMDWSHCPQKLSSKCRGRFLQDLCFYECSPNVGPWLVKVDGMKIRKERFVDVPLCRQECDAWWDDCKEDHACIENWTRGFNWSSGFPACPAASTCKPMREIYNNASHFCETVWDHSWKVVDNDDPGGCMIMWWNKGDNNPNTDIAYRKAQQLVSTASKTSIAQVLNYASFVFIARIFHSVFV